MISKNYEESLEWLKYYLRHDLKVINIQSAIIYGSFINNDLFVEGVSDIDIIAYVNELDFILAEKYIKIIKDSNKFFVDKPPVYFNDAVAERLEFYLKYNDISFDITILSTEFPKYDFRYDTVCYDSLEILIGALCKYNIVLFGNPPHIDKKEFFPFYSNKLRSKRLNILKDRLFRYTQRIKMYIDNNDGDLFDFIYRTRTYFLKYLFIYYGKYPFSLTKHLYWQLKYILHLDENEISIILFKKGTLLVQSTLLLNLIINYIDREFENGQGKIL